MFLKVQLGTIVKKDGISFQHSGMYRDFTYRTFYSKLLLAFVLIVRKINLYFLVHLEKVNPNILLWQGLVMYFFFQLSGHI